MMVFVTIHLKKMHLHSFVVVVKAIADSVFLMYLLLDVAAYSLPQHHPTLIEVDQHVAYGLPLELPMY